MCFVPVNLRCVDAGILKPQFSNSLPLPPSSASVGPLQPAEFADFSTGGDRLDLQYFSYDLKHSGPEAPYTEQRWPTSVAPTRGSTPRSSTRPCYDFIFGVWLA